MLFALGALRRRVPVGKFRLLQINDIWSVLILIDKHVDGNVHVFFAYNVYPLSILSVTSYVPDSQPLIPLQDSHFSVLSHLPPKRNPQP